MKKAITRVLVVVFLAGNIVCNKEIKSFDEDTPGVTPVTYVIEKGEQFCAPDPFVNTSANQLNFVAVFDSSCIYTTTDPGNQDDINKLFGFSDCNTQHLQNSARIGWRWSNDSLRIFAFVHNNSNIISEEITTAGISENIYCNITCNEGEYVFTVNDKRVTLERNCQGNYTRYKLYPYFGGDEVAPHRIEIKITEL